MHRQTPEGAQGTWSRWREIFVDLRVSRMKTYKGNPASRPNGTELQEHYALSGTPRLGNFPLRMEYHTLLHDGRQMQTSDKALNFIPMKFWVKMSCELLRLAAKVPRIRCRGGVKHSNFLRIFWLRLNLSFLDDCLFTMKERRIDPTSGDASANKTIYVSEVDEPQISC